MDSVKLGSLLRRLRIEKSFTQKELAGKLHVSDKTVSKWERGAGCPDISLLGALSESLGVNLEKMLSGDLSENRKEGSGMKRIGFYVCPDCGNVIVELEKTRISCCGKNLLSLKPQEADDAHPVTAEEIEGEYYLTFDHEMTKTHFISFVACVTYDTVLLRKLYPEQNPELRIPKLGRGKLYYYCSRHGLMILPVK